MQRITNLEERYWEKFLTVFSEININLQQINVNNFKFL